MKVILDFNLNAQIKGAEIEATSYEDAVSKLHQMSFDELTEIGTSKEFTISKSYLYDYYQTNSGIYPKNPGPGVPHALQTDVDDINARLNNVADGVNDASNIDGMKTAINNLKK